MRALFRERRPSAVVNFAAETHVDRSIDDPAAFVRTNVAGTFELLEAARRATHGSCRPRRAPRFRTLPRSARMDAPLIGRTLGHFRVTDAMGAGGMGVVYKATDLRLKRTVALKVLPPELALDPARRARLLAEVRAASALNHPIIVTVHEIDSADATDFIAMEYLEGRPLDRLIGADGQSVRMTEVTQAA